MRTHLLQRAVLSHLFVAVPPALILGLLVVDINERNLREDAQQLHLSVAGRLRDAVEAEVRLQQAILRHGERLLSAPTGTLEEKILALHGTKRQLRGDLLEGLDEAKKLDLETLRELLT